MAGWIMEKTADNSADIHKNSGTFTCGDSLCPGVPSASCSPNISYTVKAVLENGGDGFDSYKGLTNGKDVEQTIAANACNQEMLVMWFNEGDNTSYGSILDDNSIIDIKNIDECRQIIIGTPDTGGKSFDTSSYIETGYPKVIGRESGETSGHKIKYRPTSNSIPYNFYIGHSELVEIYFPHMYDDEKDVGKNTTTIGNYAFKSCSRLSAITLSNVVTIGIGAFSNCTSLVRIDWGHSSCSSSRLKTIDNGAFENCSSLGSITLPNTLETIGGVAFKGINSLDGMDFTVTIPSTVTYIGSFAFQPAINNNMTVVLNWTPYQLQNVTFGNYIFSDASNTVFCKSIKVPSNYYNDYLTFFSVSSHNLTPYIDKLEPNT